MIRITYLSHSGFLVEVETAYFLFDFYKGELPKINTDKKFYVFISHAHFDHYRNDIFKWREQIPGVHFIVSDDIDTDAGEDIIFMAPNQEEKIDGCKIRTLRSTDEGVAFLLRYEEYTVYHAGDLNWWHWEEEGEAYNTMMRRNYQREINKLQGMKIDVAFIPVDPRLGDQYCWGLDCFMKRTETKAVFPMHFWDNYSIFDRLQLEDCTKEYADKIQQISEEGQVFQLEIGGTANHAG
ncbi:MBL fold metallo-hydrolase [Clostridium sp. C105KSO13]|uniref:MBL fold metallo-hydrolase n=1 Tax=Clostridium sp. C105KSO13 TaxID=1776045 RepID=UPI00074068F8|nr:MBL fold metallo-hydrolase [Clostridium sp. C105KSO13]CUX42147.1 metal-dependent hydrolase [Clostridium sp. C105KSO13]